MMNPAKIKVKMKMTRGRAARIQLDTVLEASPGICRGLRNGKLLLTVIPAAV
jgi:hypothetical protein